jgi:predicted small integral membrane protein
MPSWRRIPAVPGGERLVVVLLAGGLVAYAVLALAAHRWVSGLAAPLVAGLLVIRHPRARFSAYVFFSALALRGLLAGTWPLALFAGAGILVLQTAPATRAWPRLLPGTGRSGPDASSSTRARDCSRMSGP